jgi:hypothetical protein
MIGEGFGDDRFVKSPCLLEFVDNCCTFRDLLHFWE